MTTVSSLINLSLKMSGIVGVGQQALADDANQALTLLNQMIAQWRRNKWLVYGSVDIVIPCTGALNYTIGPSGANVTAPRPFRIEAAFVRQLNVGNGQQPDNMLTVLNSREDYDRISLKNLGTYPYYIWLDPTYPNATAYPWPLPTSIYEVHISALRDIASFPNLATTIALPPEYETAMQWGLTKLLRTAYRRPPDAGIDREAAKGLKVLRQANAAIPRLTISNAIPGAESRYNIYSDTGI